MPVPFFYYSLKIYGNRITDLNPLSGITSVGEHLVVENADYLTNLEGLHNVTSVGEHLTISNNDELCQNLVQALIAQIGYANIGRIYVSSNKDCSTP